MATTRASLLECLKSSHDIISELIPIEHQQSFLNDPESVSNATFTEVLAKIEKKKLSYRERLSPHGWRIVRMVMKEKKLVDFIKMWRQHFIDTMKPKMMPYMWENCPEVYKSFGLSRPTEDELVIELDSKPAHTTPDQALI